MSYKSKQISKLATIDAARVIYFIVVGLAIKESLGIFSPSSSVRPENWEWYKLLIVGAGYIFTAIRFSHGVSMLFGHEKERVETTNLPSSKKIFSLSLFVILNGIFLYLMATNIISFQRYIAFMALMLFFDLVLIKASQIIRQPFYKTLYKMFINRKEFIEGYPPRTAIQWIRSNFILLICLGFFYLYSYKGISTWILLNFTENNSPLISSEVLLGWILIFAGCADYWFNRAFYFGGKRVLIKWRNWRDLIDWRNWIKHKFVFVCSPLSPPNSDQLLKEVRENPQNNLKKITNYVERKIKEKSLTEELKENKLKNNINLAQTYCFNLLENTSLFKKKITPFASHCFYTYFLDDKELKDRDIGRQCALSFLAACDSIYVYTPDGTANEDDISRGMKQEINSACKLGLEIKYRKKENNSISQNWKTPSFKPEIKPVEYEIKYKEKTYKFDHINQGKEKESKRNSKFEGTDLRKRVYVCTHLRSIHLDKEGKKKEFTDLPLDEQKKTLRENIKKTLWQCHELARDDEAFIAPFAPQAFFTYFWNFYGKKGNEEERLIDKKWNRWFESSIRVLEVCDAVYIYTEDGLPDSKYISNGMKEVEKLAETLGLEIIYKKEEKIPDNWEPALPNFFD